MRMGSAMLSGISVRPLLSAAKSAQAGVAPLAWEKRPSTLTKHEVVLVPEAVLALEADCFGNEVMDGEVVGLGPGTDRLQGLPVSFALSCFRWNPGVVLGR